MIGSNTTKPYEPKPIVSVRPTRDGQWEVVQVTHREEHEWRRAWREWWINEGEALAVKHPDWWN